MALFENARVKSVCNVLTSPVEANHGMLCRFLSYLVMISKLFMYNLEHTILYSACCLLLHLVHKFLNTHNRLDPFKKKIDHHQHSPRVLLPYRPPSRKLLGSFPMSSPVNFHHSGTSNRSLRLTANRTIGSLWLTCSQIISTVLPLLAGACTQPQAHHAHINKLIWVHTGHITRMRFMTFYKSWAHNLHIFRWRVGWSE